MIGQGRMANLKETWATITLVSMLQWAWGVPVSLLAPMLGGAEKAFAADISGSIIYDRNNDTAGSYFQALFNITSLLLLFLSWGMIRSP